MLIFDKKRKLTWRYILINMQAGNYVYFKQSKKIGVGQIKIMTKRVAAKYGCEFELQPLTIGELVIIKTKPNKHDTERSKDDSGRAGKGTSACAD